MAPKRRARAEWALRSAIGSRMAAIAGVAAMVGCAALDEPARPTLDEIAARMPREISGFVLGETTGRPGPQLVLDYATRARSAVATVLVYETGGRPAPADAASPELDRELTAAVAEVAEAPTGRTGRRLAERSRVSVPDPGLRCALMEGSFGRAPVTRHLCLGVAQGRFVKVQVTMPTRTPPPADAIAFASGAVRAVRGR